MRKSIPTLFAIAILIVAALPALGAGSPQKPGKWQVKMEMEVPGVPVKMPPVVTDVCLSQEDIDNPQKSVPVDPQSDCKVGDYKIDGKVVSWTVDCPKQNMKGSGSITFTDTTYAGTMNMSVGDQQMKAKYSGKWLGECAE